MKKENSKVCLIIMDGWGHGKKDHTDAVHSADTPFIDSLYQTAPHAELRTDGVHVGLPVGQMGNSEVGHMNIGAGRIVYQDLVRINLDIASGEFEKNPVLLRALDHAKSEGVNVHLMGLVSDGGVHSHILHLEALCNAVTRKRLDNVFVHAFLDGRDTDPNSGNQFIRELEDFISGTPIRIASVSGRYYAMDRDNRWERIALAYNALVKGEGKTFLNSNDALQDAYNNNVTDEFVKPSVIVDRSGNPLGTINERDVVICFNFRTDRCREITRVLTQEIIPGFDMKPLALHYVTMTNYDETFANVNVLYTRDNLEHTIGEVIADAGLSQLRIAETEKYPHVTFFFSGGRETYFRGEERSVIPSPKVATYDLQPEMSAFEVAATVCAHMEKNTPAFICLNFANPDMVGHTGVFSAIIKAVETTDRCVRQVVEKGKSIGYQFVIIADHGNAECAINDDGSANTSHTTNPVPVFIISPKVHSVADGILADVAPTILAMMGIDKPLEMTGKVLSRDLDQ